MRFQKWTFVHSGHDAAKSGLQPFIGGYTLSEIGPR